MLIDVFKFKCGETLTYNDLRSDMYNNNNNNNMYDDGVQITSCSTNPDSVSMNTSEPQLDETSNYHHMHQQTPSYHLLSPHSSYSNLANPSTASSNQSQMMCSGQESTKKDKDFIYRFVFIILLSEIKQCSFKIVHQNIRITTFENLCDALPITRSE